MIKLAPDGRELWRVAEFGASGLLQVTPSSSVATDNAGNSFFFGAIFTQGTPGWQYFLSKFDPDGRQLWRTTLPGYGDWLQGFGLGKPLLVQEDGSAVILGTRASAAVVAKFGLDGRLLWLTSDPKRGFWPGSFSSVIAKPNGAVLATGREGFALISRNGNLLAFDDSRQGDEAIDFLPDGGFILSQSYGAYVLAFGPGGHLLWAVNTDGPLRFGTAPDGTGGWITAGAYLDRLYLGQIGADGRIVSQGTVPGYRIDDSYTARRSNSFLRAPDGTYRVVVNLEYNAGVAVSAFRRTP